MLDLIIIGYPLGTNKGSYMRLISEHDPSIAMIGIYADGVPTYRTKSTVICISRTTDSVRTACSI